MKRLLLSLFIILCCASASTAQQSPAKVLRITSIDVKQNAETVDIEFSAQLEGSEVESKSMLIITPELIADNGKSAIEFPEIIVRGEFAQKKYDRNGNDKAMGYAVKRPKAVHTQPDSKIDYKVSIPYGKWMENGCSLKFNGILRGKAYAAETFIGIAASEMKIIEKIQLIYPDKKK